MKAESIGIIGLQGFPLIKPGDDLAKIVVETAKKNGVSIDEGDVLVIAQKIVSKAEGRVIRLSEVKPSGKAKKLSQVTGKDPRLLELVLKETKEVLKASQGIIIVEDKRQIVCINAGIDKSNVPGKDTFTLLPEDPDKSARRLQSEIFKLTGKNVAVIISDTYSRPFRRGQVNFAVGIAGLNPFKDYRGKRDLFHHVLRVKNVAIADEIASAAELIMGQGNEAIPVVIIKNLRRVEFSEAHSIKELEISREEDLFKKTL